MRTVFFDRVYQYSQSEMSFFRWTTWSVVLGVIFPVVNNGSFLTNLISVLSTAFAIVAIYFYYANPNTPKTTGLGKFFSVVVIYMLIIGIIGGSLFKGKTILLMTIGQDIKYVALFWLGGLFASSDKYMAYFHIIMKKLAWIAVVMCTLATILLLMTGSFIQRGSEDTTIYHLWWSATGMMYCCYYGLMVKSKDRRLFILVLFFYFVLGMAFLKRSCFIDTLLILALSLFISSRNKGGNKTFRIILILVVIMVLLLSLFPAINNVVFSALFDRFNSVDTIDEFDRMIEWIQFQSNSTLTQKITGFGIGNYLISDRYGTGDTSILNALHLGYANIIYKGGILYALFYVVLYLKIFRVWFNGRNKSPLYYVCLGVAISSLVSLLYEGSWTYTITPFCISAPIFYAANYKRL